jgi:ferredoxin
MACQNGCLGLGSCAQSCPVDAIVLRNGVIGITDRCTGCGLCVRECPKGLIEIVPRNEEGTYACAADKRLVTDRICPAASGNFWLNSSFYKDSDFKIR